MKKDVSTVRVNTEQRDLETVLGSWNERRTIG